MSVLIVGDLHLGKVGSIGKPGIGQGLNSRIIDQIKLLDWVLDQACSNSVRKIILTGDICEAVKPDYVIVELFIDFLKRCEDNDIEVHIIAGNHDLKRTGTKHASYLDLIVTAELPGVYVYKSISTIYEDDCAITLMPFRDLYSLECKDTDEAMGKLSQLLAYESVSQHSTKLLVGHLALEGALYIGDEFDNLARELMCPLGLFEGYNYVWMGHVHRPQVMRDQDDSYIAHVGSLDLSDFGETDHQKIIILFDPRNPAQFKEITVPTRSLKHVSLDVAVGQDPTVTLLNKIKAMHEQSSFKDCYLKIDVRLLDENIDSIDRDIIFNYLNDLEIFYLSSFQEVKTISIVKNSVNIEIDSAIGPKKAIDIWADNSEFDSDDFKNQFKTFCYDIINEQGDN